VTTSVDAPAITALEARGVAVDAGGTRILQPTSLTVPVGSLVALIGPSGSGKSTLLRAMAGVALPAEGDVLIGGDPVRLRSTEVGYVPFGTLLHAELTVREALAFAARLRLPPETPDEEIAARVTEVIGELSMEASADTRIADLSDGQRRRASCGAELVGRPAILVLDEPATGLDPALEARVMAMLRRLATEGRGVLLATHATSSLRQCDVVAEMAQGGDLRFAGTPDEVLAHFGVTSFDEIYAALELEDGGVPAREVAADDRIVAAPRVARPYDRVPPMRGQLAVLARRYAMCTRRDRRQLLLLLGQAPIIGIAIGLVLPRNAVSLSTLGPYNQVLICFIVLTGCLWLGIITACREIVRERAIVAREVSVGVRLDAYIAAKCAVLFPLVALEVALLVIATLFLQPLGGGPGTAFGFLVVCVLGGWAGSALGLWLSAYVRTADQATGSVPLVLIPQLLFAGALIPFNSMLAPLRLVADVTVSRWALSGTGNILGLGTNLSPDIGAVTGFEPGFYQLNPTVSIGALLLLTLMFLSAAGMTLERRLAR
jgi:ABC-type multidrug transport system ATPase subunit